jgi:photosystem II stability/assembly factor-like uncharacterized protein
MKNITLILFAFIITGKTISQTPSWHVLPNAPTADSGVERFDDEYFINSLTGWIVEGIPYFAPQDTGKVYKTTDGGHNWMLTNRSIQNYLRSTGFFDANTGIIGAINDSLHILYRTTDGGNNWTDITSSIQGTKPSAICGISIVNSTTAFASGRYYCPANVIKTTNAGLNWVSLPIDTSLVRSLVDCYFWSADSGFIVGGYSPNNLYYTGHSVVLMTVNGGLNWTRVYYSTRISEWCWKIQFVNPLLGYVSIERDFGLTYYLKTTNGGLNWADKPFMVYDVEGIGFLNENTGWIGGWGVNPGPGLTYETTNAGANWHLAGWGINMNRIRFISDTLAYAVGKTVYKYTREPIGIQPISTEVPKQFSLGQNYPNPFNPGTKIRFSLPFPSKGGVQEVRLIIYDVLGREITTLVNEQLKAGIYEVSWDASNFPSGVYFYKLQTDNYTESKKMILVK